MVGGEWDSNKLTNTVVCHMAVCGYDYPEEFIGSVGAYQGISSKVISEAITKFGRSKRLCADLPDFVRRWMGDYTPGQSHRLLRKRAPTVGFDTACVAPPRASVSF